MHTTQDRLLHDAIHDHLTGLPNRRLLLDRMETALINARQGGEGMRKPALVVLDIDRFKQVNESVGVSAGDIILLTIARRLARVARPVIRWRAFRATVSRLSSSPSRSRNG